MPQTNESQSQPPSIDWHVWSFDQLNLRWLYRILQARQEVFIVGQKIICQDIDDVDLSATHVIGSKEDQLVAYARILAPGVRYNETSIGRVLTKHSHRGTGLGIELMQRAIEAALIKHPHHAIRISAQAYLQDFYAKFGFIAFGPVYLEEGIDHIAMRRGAPAHRTRNAGCQ